MEQEHAFEVLIDEAVTPKDIVRTYRRAVFEQQEQGRTIAAYDKERELLACVREGNEPLLRQKLLAMKNQPIQVGHMAQNPLRQTQFLLVSAITLFTRYAIEGGLSETQAYNLSDAYLQKAERCDTTRQVMELFSVAACDFAQRVYAEKQRSVNSYPVLQCIRYIDDHLHHRITLAQLAAYCGVTPPYLSALFKKETGHNISRYILTERLRIAAQMLAQSSYTIQEIAEYLAFSNASAFCDRFHRQYGITPKVYRQKARCGQPTP
ncbi:MAG: AraC family transcriptional regulator [Oscillospiraceae bacterium]|nr:AraC family transcriptional regulator [Oscillospiraceae bacterium]